jgi:hypothetical protein
VEGTTGIDLYWIPLGSGASVVRRSGKIFEALSAAVARRSRFQLFHSALEVRVPAGRFVIEMTPVVDRHGEERGVVGEGAVGSKRIGFLRLFRYEIRCWPNGDIPDVGDAVGGPIPISQDVLTGERLIAAVPTVPLPVWGRDEHRVGEMWNSNSVTSWLLVRSGIDISKIQLPDGGRAPGWNAGIVIAELNVE